MSYTYLTSNMEDMGTKYDYNRKGHFICKFLNLKLLSKANVLSNILKEGICMHPTRVYAFVPCYLIDTVSHAMINVAWYHLWGPQSPSTEKKEACVHLRNSPAVRRCR